MANMLKMAKLQAIISLLEMGWAQRRVAREVGVDRETVARYDRLRRERASTPAIAPSGSEAGSGSNPANPPSGASAGRKSQCAGFEAVIQSKLDAGLSARRIWQDLVSESGFSGGYDAVKRFVRRLGASTPLAFRRMECEPGAEAQIDFGSARRIPDGGVKRQSHVLRVVLSFSRKGYSESVFRQDTESFIRCLENAFRAFGGVPRTLVIDNLKAAVTRADWYDPELNPKIAEFARHYGTVILPAKPYTPRHKGKVESGVKYVKSNALKGREFESLAGQNLHLAHWERTVADTRIHGTTRQQVKTLFEEVERPALAPFPARRFLFTTKGGGGFTGTATWRWRAPITPFRRSIWGGRCGCAGTAVFCACTTTGSSRSPSTA